MPRRREKLPPVVIGSVLMEELGPNRGKIIWALMQAGIQVVMDPLDLSGVAVEEQRERWKAARDAYDAAAE